MNLILINDKIGETGAAGTNGDKGKNKNEIIFSVILIIAGLALGVHAANEFPSCRFPLKGKWKHSTSESALINFFFQTTI